MILFLSSTSGQDLLVLAQANDWHLCKKSIIADLTLKGLLTRLSLGGHLGT